MNLVAVIPVLDEAATIADVIAGVRLAVGARVVVVDGGSRDGTIEVARRAGAEVVHEGQRGYGRACHRGVARAAELDAGLVAFLDGAGAEDPADLPGVVGPIVDNAADLVVGHRVRARRERGALSLHQRIGNRLATRLIHTRTGVRYRDLGSMRAIRLDAYRHLAMQEMTWGWPVEMQVKAAARGLRIREVPIGYRRRKAGRSKVSGSVKGAVWAGATILRVVLSEGRR